MGSEEDAFTRAVLADPDSPDAYLVYGDWLATQGDPRSELIAVQAELTRRPGDVGLRRRERQLLATDAWLGHDLHAIARVEWHCGFPRAIVIDTREGARGDLVRALESVDGRTLVRLELLAKDLERAGLAALVGRVASWPHLAELVIAFGDGAVRAQDVAPLLARLPPKLRRLALVDTRFTSALVEMLGSVPAACTLDLSWGNLTAGECVRARERFGARIALGYQDDPETYAARRQRFEEGMRIVLAEADADWEYDSAVDVGPYDPWARAGEQLAHVELSPFLAEALLDADEERQRWTVCALGALGAKASPTVLNAVFAHLRGNLVLKWTVDEARSRRCGLHVQRDTRELITTICENRGPEEFVRHIAELLESDDADVVLFALGNGVARDNSGLERFLQRHPKHAPGAHLRALLEHDDGRIRARAAEHLTRLGLTRA